MKVLCYLGVSYITYIYQLFRVITSVKGYADLTACKELDITIEIEGII